MPQQFYFWAHTQKNGKKSLKEIYVRSCSWQRYSQQPKGEATQVSTERMWPIHTWDTIPPEKGRKLTHALTWANLEDNMLRKISRSQKDRHGMIPIM